MKKVYYVYVYLDPRKKGEYCYGDYKFDYEPFYVGKGIGNRYLKHLLENSKNTSNHFKHRIINKIRDVGLEPIIIKVKTGLGENKSYEIETELIKLIGRRCINEGPLTNILIDVKPPSNYIKLNNKIVKKIIKLYNDGHYLKHIGEELNLNENKIKRVLIENGITPKRKPPINKIKLNNSLIKKMINDYELGLSIRKIQNIYNISYEVVRKTLKNNGVVFRGYDYPKTKEHIAKTILSRKGKYTKFNNPNYKHLSNDEIEQLYDLRFNKNKKIKDIMTIMGISQSKYYDYINKIKK